MTLRRRLFLIISALVATAALAVAVALGWQARSAILVQAEADGNRIAAILSHAASVATAVPEEIEAAIGEQMVSKALLTAHLFQVAEEVGLRQGEIEARLAEIAARSSIAEIWSLDVDGRARYGSIPGAPPRAPRTGCSATLPPTRLSLPENASRWSGR